MYVIIDNEFLTIELYSTSYGRLYWKRCNDLAHLMRLQQFWLDIIN